LASNQQDEPVADAVVVAVPETRFRSRPDRYRKALTDQSGRFTLRGLPSAITRCSPGKASTARPTTIPNSSRAMKARSKALHVTEGLRVSVQLKTIPAVEDQP